VVVRTIRRLGNQVTQVGLSAPGEVRVVRHEDAVVVKLSGTWTLDVSRPSVADLQAELRNAKHLSFRDEGITAWDTGLLLMLLPVVSDARSRNAQVDLADLPSGIQRLLNLALAVSAKKDARTPRATPAGFERIGLFLLHLWAEVTSYLNFVGELTLSLGRLVRGQARFRRNDLLQILQQSGVGALGIVGLISFLVGLILAFMGSLQLEQFGAQIFVADLVGLGMLREMAPMMTGIVMAGRTGASYAAQLGTMMVNEEIDSLKTVGISPIDFLVLPRILALVAMMPLLVIYADLFGLLGGFLIGVTSLDLSPSLYWDQTFGAVDATDFAVGLVKSLVIGGIVAFAGCIRGMQCGRSASEVGSAATSAVVTGIVLIIVAEAAFAFLLQMLGI